MHAVAVKTRAARPDEAETLSALAMRSKASWGYDEAFLASCREDLRIRSEEVLARRTLAAERAGRVIGVATLEGEPPEGEMGLLFIEPDAIGTGAGRALYQQVLDNASRWGFTRVRIQSDPHAEGFYLAMGARPAERMRSEPHNALPLLIALPSKPEPAWSKAWSEGGGTVQIGNVAAFNGQFTGDPYGPDHYSCLAAFCGQHPAMIVLPERVENWWIRHLTETLGWSDVEVHSGVTGDIQDQPDLLERLRSQPAAIRAWGRTKDFETLSPSGTDIMAVIRRYESKRHSHTLFRSLASDHPGIVVAPQRSIDSPRALGREIAAGTKVVVKSEYGAGGSGTRILTGKTHGIHTFLRRSKREGALLEEYVEGSGPYRDPTFDAVIDAEGRVHPVGVGLMDISGTSYAGVTIGPDILPAPLATTATTFGMAVGQALADEGYRGWYDVDFVTDHESRLAPVEINLRLTGPAVAFHIQAALDRLHGGDHYVRTIDLLPLGARLPDTALRDHFADLTERVDATLLLTIPTAAFDPAPYLGVAIAARTRAAMSAAEATIRGANADLRQLFADLTTDSRGARGWRRGPVRRRRSST